MEIIFKFEKTSNPVFTEGKDLQGNMPSMPRTDSMFDHKDKPAPAKKPDNNGMAHGQRHTGHQHQGDAKVTQPGTNVRDGVPNIQIYFDNPGDFQPAQNF